MEAAVSDQKGGEKGVHPDSLRDMAALLGFAAPEPGKLTHFSANPIMLFPEEQSM